MNTAVRSTLVGMGMGAGLMFLLDPGRGARRRALVRDKAIRATRKSRDAYVATRRDLGNRARGVVADLRARSRAEEADDETILERVRAKLGRVASHPRALTVRVRDGCVTLTGDVLGSEARSVVSAVRGVRGVCRVDNGMAVHSAAENVPSLQGHSERTGRWTTWLSEGWSPTMLVAGAAAITAATVAAIRRAA